MTFISNNDSLLHELSLQGRTFHHIWQEPNWPKPLLFVPCPIWNVFPKLFELGTCFYCGYHF